MNCGVNGAMTRDEHSGIDQADRRYLGEIGIATHFAWLERGERERGRETTLIRNLFLSVSLLLRSFH